jgi:hypothetical protein
MESTLVNARFEFLDLHSDMRDNISGYPIICKQLPRLK